MRTPGLSWTIFCREGAPLLRQPSRRKQARARGLDWSGQRVRFFCGARIGKARNTVQQRELGRVAFAGVFLCFTDRVS